MWFFFIFCAFPITVTALYYSTSYPLGYFICIILCKYVSLHCAMHLKGFPGDGESYRLTVRDTMNDSYFLITIFCISIYLSIMLLDGILSNGILSDWAVYIFFFHIKYARFPMQFCSRRFDAANTSRKGGGSLKLWYKLYIFILYSI